MSNLNHHSTCSSKAYRIIFCILLICLAASLRFSHLGDADFGIDEILQVYAAQGILHGGPPMLPSGLEYERGLPFSYLVAIAGYFGGVNEFALRLPSAILGVFVVFFVYWLTARWYSLTAGFVAAFFTAFSPIQIAHSREVRMYMLFQLLFLLTMFFFYEGFETTSPKNRNNSQSPSLRKWLEIYQIRPLFLLWAGITFLIAWKVQELIFPALSGFPLYILVMGLCVILTRSGQGPIGQKYIVTTVLLMLGALAGSFLFPHTIAKLTAVMYAPLTWGQEHADNWNYYRWLLLDEYPIIFGCLSILLLSCLLKNTKNGLFLCCALLIPFFLHSVILPMKTYRYIMYLLPLMFMAAGVGVATIFQYVWTASKQLNIHGYVSHRNMAVFVSGVLALVMMGTLINMPWFLRTLKDYTTDFQSPHVTDVQHHHWNHAVHYISEHSAEGDVIVSGYPLLTRHYGATQPLYFMNTTYLPHNIQRNFKNEKGELIDYTFGAPVLSSLDDLQRIMKSHRSGWIMTYKWRNERYWNNPDHATSISGTFPDDVLQYMEDNLELQEIPNAPDMALWRWNAEIS